MSVCSNSCDWMYDCLFGRGVGDAHPGRGEVSCGSAGLPAADTMPFLWVPFDDVRMAYAGGNRESEGDDCFHGRIGSFSWYHAVCIDSGGLLFPDEYCDCEEPDGFSFVCSAVFILQKI